MSSKRTCKLQFAEHVEPCSELASSPEIVARTLNTIFRIEIEGADGSTKGVQGGPVHFI
jgi:hypothetical protein